MTTPTDQPKMTLTPCPFCGGSDLHVAAGLLQQVYCERCDAYGPARLPPHAEAAWNRRAPTSDMKAPPTEPPLPATEPQWQPIDPPLPAPERAAVRMSAAAQWCLVDGPGDDELRQALLAGVAEIERLHEQRVELQAEIERLKARCAQAGVEARRADRAARAAPPDPETTFDHMQSEEAPRRD